MKLEKLYSLRKDFTVIGLTGRAGAGCSEIAEKISNPRYNEEIDYLINEETSDNEQIKINICAKYLKEKRNWQEFKIIKYKDVLLLHLLHEATIKNEERTLHKVLELVTELIFQNGSSCDSTFTNRFDRLDDDNLKDIVITFLKKDLAWYNYLKDFPCEKLNDCLSQKDQYGKLYNFYFNFFENFSRDFYEVLNKYNITKRTRLVHDLANNLRDYGTVENSENKDLNNIYTVAETINRIIKSWRSERKQTKIVIDALKNSLELMYFKEKYSAFYMIATNKEEAERKSYIKESIESKYSGDYTKEELVQHISQIKILDDGEYDGGAVNEGEFSEPDIENCIQKSDFHIFFSSKGELEKTEKQNGFHYLSLDHQLVKLLALLHQPGIVTPTAVERSMQVAYNAKFNSGCISRQVGAVVTDSNYSVKAIGWNDVPQNQIPCNLRNANDLKNELNSDHFSDFEKGSGNQKYKDGTDFKTNFTQIVDKASMENLQGRNCSFCFKTFHNAFEGEKNQVHTRSLHAEENAMLQISKYGGQGLKGGNLFTTASPCELCSKKAFQLGIENIFYIDPYPGIATNHILKNGINKNPKLYMFQGALGRTFHKLYEPFMAYKDEVAILTKISPKPSDKQIIEQVKDEKLKEELLKALEKFSKTKEEKFTSEV